MARLGKLVLSILTALAAIEGIAFAAPADWLLKSNYSQRVAKVAKVSKQLENRRSVHGFEARPKHRPGGGRRSRQRQKRGVGSKR